MIGAIIGDIAGSKYEFHNARSTEITLWGNDHSYTDDTIMTIATADAILNNKSYKDAYLEWGHRYPNPVGAYGGRFANWLFSNNHEPYNSLGNGSAMRISSVGFLFDTEEKTAEEAQKSAEVTHNHPLGIKGAQVIAICTYRLRNGAPKDFIKNENYYDIPAYKPFSNPFDETCNNAVPIALSCFLASESFEDAIRKSIIVGGDSDTIGAITGSLAEAYYGVPDNLKEQALKILPDDMKKIVNQFYNTI